MPRRGFTLVEVLVYTALVMISLTAVFLIYRSALETHALIAAQRGLIDAERPVELQLRSRIVEASAVTAPASGTSTGLTVSSPDSSKNPTVFALTNGAITMKVGSGATAVLTPSDVTVTDFSVTRSSGSPASVLISMTLQTQTVAAVVARTFSFTVTLRYE